jgi:hypothetical protein
VAERAGNLAADLPGVVPLRLRIGKRRLDARDSFQRGGFRLGRGLLDQRAYILDDGLETGVPCMGFLAGRLTITSI